MITDTFEATFSAIIRPAHEGDLVALEWFGQFTHDRAIIEHTYLQQQRDEALILVAEVQGFPSGQVWLDLTRKRDTSIGIIWAFRVIDCLQGLGIGARLIAAAEAVFVARGFATSELEVDVENTRARNLYSRLGYTPARVQSGPYLALCKSLIAADVGPEGSRPPSDSGAPCATPRYAPTFA
ncbi:GNAT family N-acetyltransferase [Pendulispora brunnea]|uniref:GNAT family N-acetyltransferase n=1 Tax=Pendulispora brunnea TaxID=2905690 RepID=A0ABZ2KBU3_9BACT